MQKLMIVILLCFTIAPTASRATGPTITGLTVNTNSVTIKWDQPESRFIVEKSASPSDWYSSSECVASSQGTPTNNVQFSAPDNATPVFRVKLGLQVCEVPDPSLNWIIRARLASKLQPTNALYDIELASLTEVIYQHAPGIFDLSGIECCTNLVRLEVGGRSEVSNISSISGLTSLTYLNLNWNPITHVQSLCSLTNLTELHLWDCGIDDDEIRCLTSLKELKELSLEKNQVSDLTALSDLVELTELNVADNSISNLQPLAGLTNLVRLYVGWNTITNTGPLAGLEQLSRLNLNANPLSGIDAIGGLDNLRRLDLYDCHVTNVVSLSSLTNLTNLYLGWNRIADTTPLASLQELQYLNLSSNGISDNALIPTGSLTDLTELHLRDNRITNVASLATLTNMTWLNVGKNSISNASPFSAMPLLEYLDVSENNIQSVAFLVGHTNLHWLHLQRNDITNISFLVTNAQSGGLGSGDRVYLSGNPIVETNDIQSLEQDYGVTVIWP